MRQIRSGVRSDDGILAASRRMVGYDCELNVCGPETSIVRCINDMELDRV